MDNVIIIIIIKSYCDIHKNRKSVVFDGLNLNSNWMLKCFACHLHQRWLRILFHVFIVKCVVLCEYSIYMLSSQTLVCCMDLRSIFCLFIHSVDMEKQNKTTEHSLCVLTSGLMSLCVTRLGIECKYVGRRR